MGRVARALSAEGNLIKADRGASDINQMHHLQPLGDDSKPLPQDDGWTDRTSENGNDIYFGAFDEENKIAEAGEKRIYARNATGEAVGHVWIKKDGTIIIANDSYSKVIKPDGSWVETNGAYSKSVSVDGSMTETNGAGTKTLGSDGSFNFNGFIIDPTGAAISPVSVGAPSIAAATSLMVAGKEQAGHKHQTGTYKDQENRPIVGESGEQV